MIAFETRFATPLGEMICVADDSAVRLIDFADRRGIDVALARVRAALPATPPDSDASRIAELARQQMLEYFDGTRRRFDFPIAPSGTAFQNRCWQALLEIPFGETISYTQQTLTFAAITSLRAVAQANAHNFCAVVIPCHRVVGASGALRGYGGGVDRKRWLIDHERAVVGGFEHGASTLFATR